MPDNRLPTRLNDVRKLLGAINWVALKQELEREIGASIAVVGSVNVGKSTLFNRLKGRQVSPVTAVPGTTRSLILEQVGPFRLIDTPGFGEVGGVDRSAIALGAAQQSELIVMLLDAGSGLRQSDCDLYQQLRGLGKPVLVAVNKIDLIGDELVSVLEHVNQALGVAAIPVSAKHGTNVATRLVPEILAQSPDVAVAVARELPAFRRQVSRRVVYLAAGTAGAVGMEPVPGVDIPLLLATQARMVLRLAAVYGEEISLKRARELIAAIAGGMVFRYLAQEAAKLVPTGGWAVSGGIAAAGTWAIGRTTMEYFEGGKRLSRWELRGAYRRFVKRYKERPPEALTEAEY